MSPKPNIRYFKTVLSKVYNYPSVFNKELDKARAYLSAYDFSKLKDWLSKDNQSTLASD